MTSESIWARMEAMGLKQRDLAEAIDLAPDKVSKIASGARQWRVSELQAAMQWLGKIEAQSHIGNMPDLPTEDTQRDYVTIEVLPSFAGMGGGGNGEGVPDVALVSRHLVEDELRARASDLLLVDVRGDSMEPDFHHGDQILIDKRDTNPTQPGAFCIWDGDGYVIKTVEKIPFSDGKVRVFSVNQRYSPYEVLSDELRILGRPVWFGRRL